jgi:hypothetical protein
MMAALTNDAQGHLDRYLRQVRVALIGQSSVDASEVERDIRGHIDAELAGQPEPVDAGYLRGVLDRLGAPDQWVPSDELPAWRRVLNRLHSGPEDWRLAYITFGLFLLQPALFFLGPIPLIASFITGRAALAYIAEREETVGARRWLIYPSLLVWYVPFVVGLLGLPLGIAAGVFGDNPAVLPWLLGWFPEPHWIVAPAFGVAAFGAWLVVLGALLLAFRLSIPAIFWPFADWFAGRHARRVVYSGVLLSILGGMAVWGAIGFVALGLGLW